ncbi:MAG TPA: tRNA 4-thiouridine(8) synthase ThiI [bacterium]|nr:tRNA 4-thiouridine(8) synthase ThiI [bacterium]
MPDICKVRALSLLSGGLDSLLAVKVLQEQGIEVTGLTFTSPFFGAENARRGADQLGIELVVCDITKEMVSLVKNPPHGYGKGMNPCIDCHSLMVKKAGEFMERDGFDFIATGEVLGERPMSQNIQSLSTVARDSGYAGYLLRPLSAKLLEPTKPEREGKVDREKLLAIEGRSRKPQMALATKYGITSYLQPAGGCLLTDPAFSARLRDLLKHDPSATPEDIRLLRMGRHFRLASGAKAIVGRDEKDNRRIEEAAREGDCLVVSDITPGPVVLLTAPFDPADVDAVAQLCASFADNRGEEIDLEVRLPSETKRMRAKPSERSDFDAMRI